MTRTAWKSCSAVTSLSRKPLAPAHSASYTYSSLSFALGQFERRILGPVSVALPGQVVAAQGPRVVLQLHQMKPAPAQDQQVDFVPLSLPVAELQVRPRPERRVVRQQRPDDVEPLGLVREQRGSHLDPALDLLRHGAVSLYARPDVPCFIVAEEANPASHPAMNAWCLTCLGTRTDPADR
jgi:hypothetical protein